jgi:hypothetical protein
MRTIFNRTLFFYLILPLATVATITFLIAYRLREQGLFINLATDFVSIIITVFYVDWTLHRFEEQRWKGVSKYISDETSRMAMGLIGDIADITGLYRTIYPKEGIELAKKGKLMEWLQVTRENVRQLTRKELIHSLKKLDRKGWEEIAHSLESRKDESAVLISQFGGKMKPSELESVLRFRQSTYAALSSIKLMKPFLGLDLVNLPEIKGGSPENYTYIQTIRSAIELQDAMQRSLDLTEAFSFSPEVFGIDFENEIAKGWQDYWNND